MNLAFTAGISLTDKNLNTIELIDNYKLSRKTSILSTHILLSSKLKKILVLGLYRVGQLKQLLIF